MDQEANETIISLIKDLQKQITYLERKIDTLVAQSAGRSSGQRNYSSPSRGYGEQRRYDNSRASHYGPKPAASGHSFDKKRSEEGGRYVEKKRPFRPGDRDRAAKKMRT